MGKKAEVILRLELDLDEAGINPRGRPVIDVEMEALDYVINDTTWVFDAAVKAYNDGDDFIEVRYKG